MKSKVFNHEIKWKMDGKYDEPYIFTQSDQEQMNLYIKIINTINRL